MPTNQEFTTWARDDNSRYNDTLFQLTIIDQGDDATWKTKSGYFKLIHVPTRVAMWTHRKPLPDWAFKQQEINGNKNALEKTATWYVDDLVGAEDPEDFARRTAKVEAKPPKKRNFLKKFFELQMLMLQHNAGLTASHPYASNPINWPFVVSGISFWTDSKDQRQIYMIGNIISWWTCTMSLSVFIGVLAADLLARRRGVEPIPERKLIPVFAVAAFLNTCSSSRPEPPLEQCGPVFHWLDDALLPLLPNEPSTIHSSLPWLSSLFRPHRWLNVKLHHGRVDQLSDFTRRTQDTDETDAILRFRTEGSCNRRDFHVRDVLDVRLYLATYIRHSWVSFIFFFNYTSGLADRLTFLQSHRRAGQRPKAS